MITLDGRVDNRTDDPAVSATDNESVLLRVVLILVVDNKSFTSEVVSLSLSSSAVLRLVALRIGFVLKNLHVCHENLSTI